MPKCIECGARVRGRSDKKFCDSNCRNAFHNEKSRPIANEVRKINRHLASNRNTLERLQKDGVDRLPVQLLKSFGFDEMLFTSKVDTHDGGSIYFVYDQAFTIIDNEIVILVAQLETYRQTG